jgi:hypothetical protein
MVRDGVKRGVVAGVAERYLIGGAGLSTAARERRLRRTRARRGGQAVLAAMTVTARSCGLAFFRLTLAQRFALQGDLVRAVHQAVEDRVGERWIGEPFVPSGER